MYNSSSFNPNWVSLPSDTISDLLALKKLTNQQFADLLRMDITFVQELLNGNIPIDDNLANSLSIHLGASKKFWINRERNYQTRIKELEQNWIESLPIKDMLRLEWIDKSQNILDACLNFFGISSYLEWKHKYSNASSLAAFRKSTKHEANQYSISAWIRQGEIEGEAMQCANWNPSLLQQQLITLRKLSKLKDPKDFIPKIKEICAKCGVAVIILRTPEGCPASGATKFLSEKKALILLSFRYLSDDQFWFTLFHEIGHLLLHNDRILFIEGDNNNGEEEKEANEFSQNVLIPKDFQNRLYTMAANQTEIKKIAKDADISLGIVVGQLQHLKRLNPGYLNGFKRRYDIRDILSVSP
jgi:HTH-type transcriptional regulator/antitoxin HigA